MNYKMVVTDLDGTLLNDDKKISRMDVEILNKLHELKIEIVIATGRNYYLAKKLTEQIKNINPVILANNGAMVRRSHTDEVLECNYLDFEYFRKIYEQGLKYNLHPVLHVDEYINGYDMIYEQENTDEMYQGYIAKNNKRAKLTTFEHSINNILAVCYLSENKKLNDLYLETNKINDGKFNSLCNMNLKNKALLEFLHIDGCKWRSLKKYSESVNICANEIVSFGDDNNDIELILNSGFGIAMKNGTESCINAADKVSEFDNNNSGVCKELLKLFSI